MNKLIIAEKPSVALTIAVALSPEGSPQRKTINGVPYYEIPNGDDILYVVAAAGHLFTIRQKEGTSGFPVFNVEWVESYKQNKSSYFTKKYLDTIEIIAKKCTAYINACDYDIEGTVIGTNIIKFVSGGNVNSQVSPGNVKRMRFSTTTRPDLIESYKNITEFDANNFAAGEARHTLDWMWGINMSRALMHALMTTGIRKIISIGRVQGPTLAIAAQREYDIRSFTSKPFWQVLLKAKGVEFSNTKGNIFEKEAAEDALEATRNAAISVENVERKENAIRPYPPFDLTSLQLEASKIFKMDPSRTLQIAQSLYEKTYTSYPRTSSQKLPYTLNLPRIISELAKIQRYAQAAEYLLGAKMFRPNEGAKSDEAHPAIFPTGVMPKGLSEEEENVYDLIVRRFLSCFGNYAKVELTGVVLGAGEERYSAQGKVYKEKAWIDLYAPYFRAEDVEMPEFKVGEKLKAEKIYSKEGKTKPPARFSKASLISLLERKELGTKATRAEVIDTLFRREYFKGSLIEVTDYGLSVYTALHDYCPDIIEEELTKQLDSDMEKIMKGSIGEGAVINEGKEIIQKLIGKFRANENKIGEALSKGLQASELADVLGKCPADGGNLVVKRSRAGKQFVSCSNWPNCNTTYPLPQFAKVVPTKKVCELCHTPFVKVFRKGKRPFEMDLDPNCETKKDWGKPKPAEEIVVKTAAEVKAESMPEAKPIKAKATKRKTATKAGTRAQKAKKKK
ncbi:MAG: DNA topoisomerase I [Candidatus Micrarchaeota archaeon]|nr:DNA topoisomerase I [Candidatus Micrarchaeota archaeon]MDE1804209.1 DNA topoisomerase I [Candidatus Micrarchaeota archaeon]MDE1846665.1 DNA topoisomerase I [Candidatus Micrarchaeota archaeon]